VDCEIYLWNYDPKAANQDFVSISVPNKIIAAALTTRPDSARGNSFWLVLSTESSVVLYNLNRTVSGDDDTLQIQESATCDLDESGVKMLSLVTTPKSRIFMGGQDGIVYEMIPTAADRQKSQGGAKCRKVKQQGWCRQALSYLPAFVQGEKEAIIDLAFAPDENESCEGFLYALVRTVPVRQAVAEKDSVRVFKVNPRDNQSFGPESMLYLTTSLVCVGDNEGSKSWGIDASEKAKSLSVVRHGVPHTVSSRVGKASSYLVLTTDKGRRVFFNAIGQLRESGGVVVKTLQGRRGDVIAAHCDQGLTIMALEDRLELFKENTYHEYQRCQQKKNRNTKGGSGVEEMQLTIPLGEKCKESIEIAAVDYEVLPGSAESRPYGRGFDPASIKWSHAELSNQERRPRRFVVMTDKVTFMIDDPRYPKQMLLAFQRWPTEFTSASAAGEGSLAICMLKEIRGFKLSAFALSKMIQERIAACLGVLCSPDVGAGDSVTVGISRHLKDLIELGLEKPMQPQTNTVSFARGKAAMSLTSDGMCLYFNRVLGPLWSLPLAWKPGSGVFPDIDPATFRPANTMKDGLAVESLWDASDSGPFTLIRAKLEKLSEQLGQVIARGASHYPGGGGGGGGAAGSAQANRVAAASPVLRRGLHAHPRYIADVRKQVTNNGNGQATLPQWNQYFNPQDVCHLYNQEIEEFRGLQQIVRITVEVLALWQELSAVGSVIAEEKNVQEFWLEHTFAEIVHLCLDNFDLVNPQLHIENFGLDMLRETISKVEKTTKRLYPDDVADLRERLEASCTYIFDDIFKKRQEAGEALAEAKKPGKNFDEAAKLYKDLFKVCAEKLSEKEFCRYFNVPAGGGGGGGAAAAPAPAEEYSIMAVAGSFMAGGSSDAAAYEHMVDVVLDAAEQLQKRRPNASSALPPINADLVAAACDTCYTCIHTALKKAGADNEKKNKIIDRVLSRQQDQRGHFEIFKHVIAVDRSYFKADNTDRHLADWVTYVQDNPNLVPFLETLADVDRKSARKKIFKDLPGAKTLDLFDDGSKGGGEVKCGYYKSMELLEGVYTTRDNGARAALMNVRMAFVTFEQFGGGASYLEKCIEHLGIASQFITNNGVHGLSANEKREIEYHRQQLNYRVLQQHGYRALKERVEKLGSRNYMSCDGDVPYSETPLGTDSKGNAFTLDTFLKVLKEEIYGPQWGGNEMLEYEGYAMADMVRLFTNPVLGQHGAEEVRLWLPGSLIKAVSVLAGKLPKEFDIDYASTIRDVLNDRLWANGATPKDAQSQELDATPAQFTAVMDEAYDQPDELSKQLSLQRVLKDYFANHSSAEPLGEIVLQLETQAFESEYQLELVAPKNSKCSQSKVIKMLRGADCSFLELYRAYMNCFQNPIYDDHVEKRNIRWLVSITVLLFNWFYDVEGAAAAQGTRSQDLRDFMAAIANDKDDLQYRLDAVDLQHQDASYSQQRTTCIKWLDGMKNFVDNVYA